jgi:hypothetical protein
MSKTLIFEAVHMRISEMLEVQIAVVLSTVQRLTPDELKNLPWSFPN